MVKPKSPLLSLGARGTIADTLTYQKHGRDTITRSKPTPKDPYSLAQAYQRWDYQDYAYLWTLESESSKQAYRTRASRYHLNGFHLWMREHLRDLPDLAGRWHLDEKSGAIVHDSSRNSNNGTIFGASPISAVIDNGYHFDGINDYIQVGNPPDLDISDTITVEAFARLLEPITAEVTIGNVKLWSSGYSLWGTNPTRFCFQIVTPDGVYGACAPSLPLNQWMHLAATYDKDAGLLNHKMYQDGALIHQRTSTGAIIQAVNPFRIGQHENHSTHDIDFDHVTVYNRILDATEIKRHSERRYPA